MERQNSPSDTRHPEHAGHPRRIIWFCDTDEVAQHPEWLPVLRDEIGLTTLMAEDFAHHTSGFAASPEVAVRSPLKDWRERRDLLDVHLGTARAARGVYPVVPGVLGGVDDSNLRRLLDAAAGAGIEVWGHIGLWSYAGDVFPEFALRDAWGAPPDMAYRRWGIGFCPSKRAVNDWVAEGLADVTRRYPLAGFMVDHARYPAPASVWAMFACACPDCAAEGRRLGYDVDAIYAALRDVPARLRELTPARLARAATAAASFPDWLSWLGGAGDGTREIVAWLELRCRLLVERMAEFRTVVRREQARTPLPSAARSPEIVWGSDVFPPSVAIFGGHHYGLWQRGADYLTGGSSHGGVVGWATSVTNVALEWGRYLCRVVPGLEPSTALRLLYRLLGCDDLVAPAPRAPAEAAGARGAGRDDAGAGGLPLAFEALERGDVPVARLMEREVRRLVAGAPRSLALYPPVAAGRDSELLEALCQLVAGAGADGALLSGLRPGDRTQLATIRRHLGA